MAKAFKSYIHGEWVSSSDGKTFEQHNPADLDDVTGTWPALTREDARSAVDAASLAYPLWSSLTVYKRAEYLKNAYRAMAMHSEEIARVITLENGKTMRESITEVNAALSEMEFQIYEGVRMFGQTVPSSIDGVFAYSVRVPLGVVAVISPWNFPLNVLGRKIVPALMAGNTCVFKPSSLTPQTALKFLELFIEADLPPGVLNFVTGSGAAIGEELILNPLTRAVSFTGSTAVGRRIHKKAAENMVRTQLEMGGKNPVIVLEDADIASAAKSAVFAAYACAGQWCTSTSRAIVVRRVVEEFKSRVLKEASQYIVGNGSDPNVTMGPVCGTDQLKSVLEYIEIGKKEGATLALGGERLKGERYATGCFIAPTVFTDVTPEMTIAKEEIFGPVLSIMEVKDCDEAIKVANAVGFGLTSSIYTNDLSNAFLFLEKSHVGVAHVNLMTALKEPQLSFGGVKASGFGIPEAGHTGIEFFSEHKTAYIKYR
ncbi:MAG: aldehyde dehydrogenase family protein [Christensenellales bacterium]|jgi:acyl-CoA reductase-like NAD-dependent aldehyde dehydrogenase